MWGTPSLIVICLELLAQGIDPITRREVPDDSILNDVKLARCFFYVSGVLDQVIANNGVVGSKQKLRDFSITYDQLASVNLSAEPLRITEFVEELNFAVGDPAMKKLRTTVITDWLLAKGFLEKKLNGDGSFSRIPTQMGLQLGIIVRTRQTQQGERHAVYYPPEVQQFVLDHLGEMLSKE